MATRSVDALPELDLLSLTAPPKPHLFDLPPPLIVSAIESLLFDEMVGLVDFILLSNKKGRRIWHAQIKGMLRCQDMDNRRYLEGSLRWVLKRKITIKNFTIYKQDQGRTELHYACKDNKAWIARACIAFNDDDVNAPDEYGSTPLHLACMHSHVDMVKLLVESGAQPSLYHKDNGRDIPMEHAIHDGRVDMVKLLLSYHEKDKEMALENLRDAFVIAAQKQNLEMVKLFLGVCPDIIHSRSAVNRHTALHRSCMHSDDTEVMEFLLASGAGVNAVDDYDQTPLFNATSWGCLECAKVLLAAGADVNHRGTDRSTPLDMALLMANIEIAELLKAKGGLTEAQLPDEDDSNDA